MRRICDVTAHAVAVERTESLPEPLKGLPGRVLSKTTRPMHSCRWSELDHMQRVLRLAGILPDSPYAASRDCVCRRWDDGGIAERELQR